MSIFLFCFVIFPKHTFCWQSASMAYDEVTEKAVYQCTGNPEPKDINKAVNWLLQEDFATAYSRTRSLNWSIN